MSDELRGVNSGKLLLDEHPLVIQPKLAKLIGLNESIILQQLHYWLQKSTHERDGRRWIYNTYADWEEQFPFWSLSTIRRTIGKLEKEGLILSTTNFNKLGIDNTKWYTIDYDKLTEIEKDGSKPQEQENDKNNHLGGMSRPPVQNEQTMCSKRADHLVNLTRPMTRDYIRNYHRDHQQQREVGQEASVVVDTTTERQQTDCPTGTRGLEQQQTGCKDESDTNIDNNTVSALVDHGRRLGIPVTDYIARQLLHASERDVARCLDAIAAAAQWARDKKVINWCGVLVRAVLDGRKPSPEGGSKDKDKYEGIYLS